MIPLEYPHLEDYVEELLLIQTRYREKKRAAQAMDFDDLLENWLELLLKYGEGLPLKKQLQ